MSEMMEELLEAGITVDTHIQDGDACAAKGVKVESISVHFKNLFAVVIPLMLAQPKVKTSLDSHSVS